MRVVLMEEWFVVDSPGDDSYVSCEYWTVYARVWGRARVL